MDVRADWRVARIKSLCRVVDQRADVARLPLLSVSIHHGVIRRDSVTDDLPRAEDLSDYKICLPGDIVVNRMRAFQGAIGISAERGLVSPDYLVLRPSPDVVEGRFLHHLFRSAWFVGEMVARLRGIGSVEQGNVRTPRINAEDLGDIRIQVPQPTDQRRIANFLDAETSRIDGMVTLLRRQVEILDSRFAAVVDRGLDQAGEKLVPLKYLASMVDTEHKTAPQVLDGGYWVAGTSAVRNGCIVHEALYETDHEAYVEWTRRRRPQPGDVLLSREAPVGEVALYRQEDPPIAIGQRMVLVSPNPSEITSEYLLWALLSSRAGKFFELTTQGSLHPHLNMSDIGSIPVNWCPIERQRVVCPRIAHAFEQNGRLMQTRVRQLELLSERRQALITAAVTGQLDVTTARTGARV